MESCKWTRIFSKKRIRVNFYECATLLDDFIEVPLQTRYIPFVAPSQLLAGLPRPLCCPQLRRCSFGPLLRKLGSRVAGKEGKDPRNCSSLSLGIFLSQIISLNLFSDRSQTPFCSAGNDLLLRLVMAYHRGGSGSEGGFVLTKKISKCWNCMLPELADGRGAGSGALCSHNHLGCPGRTLCQPPCREEDTDLEQAGGSSLFGN